MPYVKFSRKEGRIRRGEYITISKYCQFSLSLDCYERFFKGYKSVIFFYDKKNNLVGLKPLKEQADDSYDIRASRTGGASPLYSVSGASFLNHFGLKPSETKKYKPEFNEREGLVEIDLNNPV